MKIKYRYTFVFSDDVLSQAILVIAINLKAKLGKSSKWSIDLGTTLLLITKSKNYSLDQQFIL